MAEKKIAAKDAAKKVEQTQDGVTKRHRKDERERVQQFADKTAAKVERMEKRLVTMKKQVEDYEASLATARYEARLWNSHPLLTDVPQPATEA